MRKAASTHQREDRLTLLLMLLGSWLSLVPFTWFIKSFIAVSREQVVLLLQCTSGLLLVSSHRSRSFAVFPSQTGGNTL